MKSLYKTLSLSVSSIFASAIVFAQDTTRTIQIDYANDPHYNKVIPDKVFEIGIPLLAIYLVANTIMSIFKIKAENRLKEKALDKGISEETLIALFHNDKKMEKFVYLKSCLVLAAVGISFIYIHLLDQFTQIRGGYLALGIMTLFISIAFFIYYRIIRKQ